MKNFTEIKGYLAHTWYRSNYNNANDNLILQINIKGVLKNRCILGIKTEQPFIRFQGDKFAVNLSDL